MNKDELKRLFEFLDVHEFNDPIDPELQKKYDLAFEDLQKKVKIQNKKVFIDNNSFIKVIGQAFLKDAKYLKIHLIKESKDLDVNIGFSFSTLEAPKDLTVDHDLDFFWTLKDGILIESTKKPFTICKKNFLDTTSKLVRESTNKECTEFIQYDIENVIRYMIRNLLSNTFDSKKFILNFFVFKDFDKKLNDRIGISVHNTLILTDVTNKKVAESIGYDFGTVYP
ncbi:hypothetical protein [Flavobacterium sp. 22076]|jgi:hypothetical protein|uniref:hypothetical protein n=1 Tax=unclassified Flavobacterium TaxID=196869 RepID=UPI003F872EB0